VARAAEGGRWKGKAGLTKRKEGPGARIRQSIALTLHACRRFVKAISVASAWLAFFFLPVEGGGEEAARRVPP
jgi:hypothetical protein